MRSNSKTTYGSVTKSFHWLTALLVISMIPLGIYANGLPFDSGPELAHKAQMFSLHKTLGVFIFFVALARILWAVSQPKPGLLNADNWLEATLAELVHWTLYGSLVLVPLTGWVHHAATTGFAPIWWPFGQGLPFVPKDDGLAHNFAALHIIFERVLAASILLHVAGAVKHHIIDKDVTLKRMLPGTTEPDHLPAQKHSNLPIFGAIAAYGFALVVGAGLGMFSAPAHDHADGHHDHDHDTTLEVVESGWAVQDGSLAITVRQLGSDVTGQFAQWTAAINFSEEADANGRHGDVEVQIAIDSLTLGSVTGQALGADFLDAKGHSTAVFRAEILADAGNYKADGTLTLKGVETPVSLPFSLQIEGDTAVMQGQTRLNRTSFNIGESHADESTVSFDVAVEVNLTATRN
ncbi:cytochrome b/b6 domain-containing protein [uncultured Litoreibacter sp.]|uniref:cytochrome b/b6 domain-containing protein n=1 Tax=uncultured Litoreibacter sp. TaxID=1392394 RepID=UPI00260EA39D|nr:cytochrome b/b6 domain-containing protein [uncultured Litoreibacter sp.]